MELNLCKFVTVVKYEILYQDYRVIAIAFIFRVELFDDAGRSGKVILSELGWRGAKQGIWAKDGGRN